MNSQSLPRIENMQQQMNNESQIHQAAQNQQETLPKQKPEIIEQQPEYQLK